MGGIVNNNSGEKSLFYGKTERYVKSESSVVDGNTYVSSLSASVKKKMEQKISKGKIEMMYHGAKPAE
jgi:hypothetical protein